MFVLQNGLKRECVYRTIVLYASWGKLQHRGDASVFQRYIVSVANFSSSLFLFVELQGIMAETQTLNFGPEW